MRTIRFLATGFALLIVSQVGSAQEGRLFKDSWFWGAKVGSVKYATREESGYAQMIGGEWLITRTRGALYVALDETFFGQDRISSVDDPFANPTFRTNVALNDMTRITVAGMIFPNVRRGFLRPYAGAGFAILNFHSAGAVGIGGNGAQDQFVTEAVEDARTGASFVGIIGMQAQFRRLSAFGQASMMPARSPNFLLNQKTTTLFETGLRYNVGTSIDRPF